MTDVLATISQLISDGTIALSDFWMDWILKTSVPPASRVLVLLGCSGLAGLVWYRSKSHVAGEYRPPVYPSWIPWWGSQWAVEKDPDAFFKAAKKRYSDGIFGVKTAGTTLYYVTSASLINQIYKQPKVFTISVIQLSWGKNCFSWSDDVLRKSSTFREELLPSDHRNISPKHMMPLVHSFAQNISRVVAAYTPPSSSVSLQDMVMLLAHRATSVTWYGPTLSIEDFYDDWKKFDEGVSKVALMYPTWLCRDFQAARARVRQKIWEYMNKPHEPGQLIRDREEIVRNAYFSDHDLGVALMTPYWPLMTNVPWASLWLLVLQLQRPEGLQPIISELDAAGEAWSSAHPEFAGPYTDHLVDFFQSQPSIPLLTSTISEVLRFTSDGYSMRGVLEDTLLGGYTIKRGDTLVCMTRSVHRDEGEFERAEEFVPTRFMGGESGKGTESEYNWLPFGGGVSMCSGRFFAYYYIKIFLTTVLKNFELEVDPLKSTQVVQSEVNRGFGLRRPKGEMYVTVTRLPIQ